MTSVVAQTADEKLETFFKSHLEESFRMRPFEATMLGDHRFDHLLDDISPEARKAWLDQYRRRLEQLPTEVRYGDLSRNAQLTSSARLILRNEQRKSDSRWTSLRQQQLQLSQLTAYHTQRAVPEQNDFLQAFGQPKRESPCTCERLGEPTIDQTLQILNGIE